MSEIVISWQWQLTVSRFFNTEGLVTLSAVKVQHGGTELQRNTEGLATLSVVEVQHGGRIQKINFKARF